MHRAVALPDKDTILKVGEMKNEWSKTVCTGISNVTELVAAGARCH